MKRMRWLDDITDSMDIVKKKKKYLGTPLGVQWLIIHFVMQGTQFPSLVGELRSHMPQLESPHATKKDSAGRKIRLKAAKYLDKLTKYF